MTAKELKGVDRVYAKAVVKLWNNPEDRRQMMECGMTDQQIRGLKEKYGL